MAITPTIRVVVCGYPKVGKSALVVRYLTRRFIGEYTSHTDLLYQYKTDMESCHTRVELLDCCRSKRDDGFPTERQLSCGDAFLVVYSVCDRDTFSPLTSYINFLKSSKAPSYVPILLLGNKTDLDHRRQVSYEEGLELALTHGCLFQESSAAECLQEVKSAFDKLLHETRCALRGRRVKKIRRRNSWKTLSKALGSIFGRVSKTDSPTKITITAIDQP